ncbi:hypothetical protein Clacol_003866 [Clathrus columnatus]|uniref:PHD-type domain-containing protein n=1 Tax=Clathrus columnatus TaxID=1419009 RepID=A0AAV5A804_9AGAM|nr:hypothetical protein Clacol_003866 [Clathrus columnatus]
MTSKRMSISALLSSDSTPAKHSESSNPQQHSSSQYHSYHPEIESVHDSVSKRSGGNPSVQTHFSQPHPSFSNSNTSSTFYQSSDNNRTSPIISEPRSVQWPNHGYPRVAERIQYHPQEEVSNPYYHSSSPSYGHRIPERERVPLSRPSSAHTQIQASHSEHSSLHTMPRSHPAEFRERDNWRFPASSSSINSSTDTSDSLLSVLTRTAASEAAAGSGQSRNTGNVNFPTHHSLRPPSALRRDRNKEMEYNRNRAEREREHEMQPHVSMPHDYQRSPFTHPEVVNTSYHYHPDASQSPDMQVLRTRSGSHGSTSTVHPPHPPSIQYTSSSRSPSRSQQQPVYTPPSNTHYHQTIPTETQSQPSSHSHHSQHHPHIENPNTRASSSAIPSANARSVPVPPRLGLTLPLSLSPATMSGQLISPISPQNPSRGPVTVAKTQMPSRSVQYSQVTSPVPRSPVIPQVKERLAAPGLPGKSSNPVILQSLRTPVPQPMPLHRLSIPHTSPMSNMTSPPHPVSFPLSSGPFSPQQQQAFRRAPNPVSTPTSESVRDTREKDMRPTKNQVTYHTGGNSDMESPRRNVERNNPSPRTSIIYDQRRTTESHTGIAELVSEKARSTNDSTSHLQQEKRISSLDKGFRLWNNGPIIEDTIHPQRMDVEVRHPPIRTETKPNEQQEFSSRMHFSRQEDSLTRCSVLPLGTLPVPSIERPQTINPYIRAGAEQGTGALFHASNQHRGARNRAVLTEDFHENAPPQQHKTSPLPNSPSTNPKSKPQSWHHLNTYPDEQHSLPARDPARVIVSPESQEKPLVQSPVDGSTFKSLIPEVESDNKLPLRTSEGDVSFSHPQSPSVLLNPSSRSPHLSATDTISSGKNSEIEANGPSPPTLSDDAPVLYDSVQYPLPSPVQDMILSKEDGKELYKESDHTQWDNEAIRRRPSVESVPPVLSPLVPPPIQFSSVEANSNDLVPSVRPKEVDEPQPGTVVEEHCSHESPHVEPEVADDQSNKELLKVEIVDVSMKDVNPQSVPSLVDDPAQQILNVDITAEPVQNNIGSPFPSRTSISAPSPIRDPIPLTVDNQSNYLKPSEGMALCDENIVNNGEEPVQEPENESHIDAPMPVLRQPPEELHENESAILPKLETSPTAFDMEVVPVSAAAPNGGDLTEDPNVPIKPSNDESHPPEDINENTAKVDAMNVSLDIQEATRPPPDGRSWEDELLSLVDDSDLKPVSDVKPEIISELPHSPVGPTSSLAVPSNMSSSRKAPSSVIPTKTKTQKSRGQAKPLKSKNIRMDSETITPSSPTSGNTPTPKPALKPSARTKKAFPGSRKKTVTAHSTARSSSVMPEPAPETTPAPLEERLYCVCHRPYDEEKVMIACDRCDEWYHPRCVNMPEQEIDLVDQFICAKCMNRYPGLKTTYKTRCHRGTNHISDYDENPPCWKTVKGAFSKYCSDACGIAHMRAKMARSGKSPNQLWPLVRHAKKREGVTVEYLYDGSNVSKRMKLGNGDVIEVDEKKRASVLNGIGIESPNIKVHTSTNGDRTRLAVLKQRIAVIRSSKNRCKLELEYVTTRRRLLDLAVERASEKFCGWDTRLEMGDHEWATWIVSLEGKGALYGNQDHPDSDDSAEGDMSWLCQGPVECPRHHGWKTVRDLELQMEVDSKNNHPHEFEQNGSIKQFLEAERELRSKIEELDNTTARSVRRIKKTSE